MKRIFISILLLVTLDCTHYFVRETSQYDLSQDELDFLKSKKIGLIGFYPFVIEYKLVTPENLSNLNLEIKKPSHLKIIEFVRESSARKFFPNNSKRFTNFSYTSNRRLMKTETTLDYTFKQTKFLEFGLSSKQLSSNGIYKSISGENLKVFLSTYLIRTKELGLNEVENLLELPEAQIKNIEMKNFDVKYWIIGYHSPGFDENVGSEWKPIVTGIPFFLSLGTIPLWKDVSVISNFFIFDKNLNQIGTIQTENLHDSITAWWIFAGASDEFPQSPSGLYYKPNLQQFSKQLVQILKK